MSHTFDPANADRLEDASRYRYLSRDELVAAFDPAPDWTVADLGSGTGFYTDDIAPYVGHVYGVDLQPAMHAIYREKGVPENVSLVTAPVGDLPFADAALDAAVSTMTFHEFATPEALTEVARVLRPEAPLLTADWSARGEDASGPPLDERQDAVSAASLVEAAGFDVTVTIERPETFVLAAVRAED